MSLVQRTHCRDESEDTIFGARLAPHLFHPAYSVDYFHCEVESRTARIKRRSWNCVHDRNKSDQSREVLPPVGAAWRSPVHDDRCHGSRGAEAFAKAELTVA